MLLPLHLNNLLAPNNALALSTSFAFGQTLDLKAIGTIVISESFAFSEIIDLKATGTLSLTTTFAFGETLTLSFIGRFLPYYAKRYDVKLRM